ANPPAAPPPPPTLPPPPPPPSRPPASLPHLPVPAPPLSPSPAPRPSAPRTAASTLPPPRTLLAPATPPASPATSARQFQRSCLLFPAPRLPIPLARSPPASLRSVYLAHAYWTRVLQLCFLAQAAFGDPPSHSPSAP